MNFIKKLFGNKTVEEVRVEEPVKKTQKVKKPKKVKTEIIVDKKKYKENKQKKIRAAEAKRVLELKALEEKRQSEYLEMQKRAQESSKDFEEKRRISKTAVKEKKVSKKVEVQEAPIDLFGYSYLGFEKGQMVSVEILKETKDGYFVRGVDNYQDAFLPSIEVENETVNVGEVVEVLVFKYYAEEYYVSRRRLQNKLKLQSELEKVSEKEIISGTVVDYKEPNFIVELENGLRGKVYIRKMDKIFIKDVSPYINNKYDFMIEKKIFNSHNMQFELNRRSILDEIINNAIENIAIGQVIEISEYEFNKGGLSFNFNAIRGFVPMRELSHSYIKSIEEAQSLINGTLKLQITDIQKKRNEFNIIGSLRCLVPSPWEAFLLDFKVEQNLTGTVTKKSPFGLFISITEGVNGLLHQSNFNSETSTQFKAIKEGDTLEVEILNIDLEKHLVSLTQIKQEVLDTEN